MLELILEQLVIMQQVIELAIEMQGNDSNSAVETKRCRGLTELMIANAGIPSFTAVEDTIDALYKTECIK